jgi:MYXO-CTERM domain-containing protein
MKGFTLWTALAVVAAGGCSSAPPAPEPTGRTTSEIQGGTSDTTHNFAVGIAIDLGGGQGAMCSGALLAPNLVATARHCVAQLSSSTVDCSTSTFGSLYSTSQFLVSNSAVLTQGASLYPVSKIVVPSGANQTKVCGNDIALLILGQNVQLPQYVEPAISPALTDHKVWATQVTAIGYGIDSPTDQTGASAGTRRILQNITVACIPNDTTYIDCFSDPTASQYMSANEFESGNGTCEGDSGSSAYDQTLFSAGTWASFGVLSRGGVSSDGTTCVGAIYTRFDAWAQLIIDTANEAAQAGGYSPPTWAGGTSSSSSSSSGASSSGSSGASSSGSGSGSGSSGGGSGSSSGATTGKADGTTCGADNECISQNCVSTDGKNYVCASTCNTSTACPSGASCIQGYCFTDAPTSVSQHSGCAVAVVDDPQPVPWRTVAAGALGAVALASARRRRRASRA